MKEASNGFISLLCFVFPSDEPAVVGNGEERLPDPKTPGEARNLVHGEGERVPSGVGGPATRRGTQGSAQQSKYEARMIRRDRKL